MYFSFREFVREEKRKSACPLLITIIDRFESYELRTTVSETGFYGFMQQSLNGDLILNAGLRHQNHSVYGNQWIPSVGFAWEFANTATWKGNISKGFRSPTIRELFLWGPNPELDPESIFKHCSFSITSLDLKSLLFSC